jgi:hypothetical protein
MKRTIQLLILCSLVWTAVMIRPPLRAEPAALPAQTVVDWRFGVVESYEAPGEAGALGVGWTRVRFQWADVQAGGPGTWTPAVSDGQIGGELAAGRMVVGLLIGIPGWARDGRGLPNGLHLPHDDPGNTWANFVREAVSRYNGRINHWIIWNEPDIADAAAPGHTWDGSVEEFAQLQRTAYLAAKQANPNAVIHLPAITYFWDPGYIYRFLDTLVADPAAAENGYYFDIATAHLYFQPATIYDVVQTFYGAMSSRGITGKSVWLVETNAPPINDPAWPVSNWTLQVTQDEQAAFIPQALATALAAGASRVAVYKLQDTADDRAANPEPFGLLRLDGSRRPAFNSYRIAIQYLAGASGARREQWNEVGQIRVAQDGRSTTVLFARLPAPQRAQVEATAGSAVLVDMWGARRTVTAQNGLFTVDLPGALCVQTIGDYCMIGGAPYYLVQSTDGGALPAAPPGAGPLPTATPDPNAPTIAATGAMTATADNTPTATATQTPRPTTPSPTATLPAPTDTPLPPTMAASHTPPPTPEITPASEVAQRPATAVPLSPPAATTTAEPAGSLSYWFIGAGLLVAVVVGGLWWTTGVRRDSRQ